MPARKTVLKWGGFGLGGVLALALLSLGTVFFLVSRLDIRGEIEHAVEGATGRKLTIAGPVGVSIWPVLGLQANQVSLANVAGGRAPAFLAADQIHIGVEIPPLFHRQVVVRQLVLDHPRIALEVEANGRPNWILSAAAAPRPQPLAAPARPAAPNPAPQAPASPMQSMQNAASQMTLRSVQINEGELSFFDARRSIGWVISKANITTAVNGIDAPVHLEGDVTYNTKAVRFSADIAQARAWLNGQGAAIKLHAQSDLLNVDFDGQTVLANAQFGGLVRASGPSLRQLASWYGAPIVGGVGLEEFAVSGRLDDDGPKLAFSNAGFSLDRIRGRGDFELSKLRGKPFLSGRVEVFDLDLNPYLTGQMPAPPPDAATPPTTATAAAPNANIAVVAAPERTVDVQAAAPSDRVIDFSGLSAVNLDLDVTTGALLFQHLRIDHAQLSLVINDGFMASTLNQVDLYGGHAHGTLQVDARENAAKIAQDITVTGVDAERFLSDAFNFTTVEGRSELEIRLQLTGRTPRDLIKASKGQVHIEVVSGALRGVDMGGLTRTISNALRGELISPQARTPFQGFSATVAVANGVLASDNLSFNTRDLAIPGIGVADLNAHTVEMRLAPHSPRGGITVPFTIIGPFNALRYNSDLRGLQRAPIQAHVRAIQAASR